MSSETDRLQLKIAEYEGLVDHVSPLGDSFGDVAAIVHELTHSHDWTENGAENLVSLAVNHGAFMLRNALALAIALGIEDGELGS